MNFLKKVKLQTCDEIIETMKEEKKLDYMNTTRLIAISPLKTLPSRLDCINALMPPTKIRNVFVQRIMRHSSMCSVGLST